VAPGAADDVVSSEEEEIIEAAQAGAADMFNKLD
jgi:hypothetical protein